MKTLLPILTVAASLIGTVSPSAFARPHNSSQGNQSTTVKRVIGETRALGQDHQDRDEASRHRLLMKHRWFWYVGLGYYQFSPDCVPVDLSPDQQASAQERIEAYLASVRQGLRQPPSHRYLVIEALPMNEGAHCVAVYDARSGKSVGRGGYKIGDLPPAGSVVQLASVRAELVV
jgi:hypothetical protein